MKKKTPLYVLTISRGLLAVLLAISFQAALMAQGAAKPPAATLPAAAPAAKPADKPAAKKGEKDAPKEAPPEVKAPPGWKARYVPAIGILAPVGGIPLSGINEYIGMGFGAELFASVDVGHLFLSQSQPYRLRAVLSGSGYYYKNKSSAAPATLMLFPVIGSLQFSYFVTKDARAIVRAGAGASFDTLTVTPVDPAVTKTSDSSLAFVYQGDIGGGYNFSNGIEVLLLVGYMGQMQTLSASYLNGRLGVAWYF